VVTKRNKRSTDERNRAMGRKEKKIESRRKNKWKKQPNDAFLSSTNAILANECVYAIFMNNTEEIYVSWVL